LTLVFKTAEDYTGPVEFVGVGVAPPRGQGGVLVERAAESMTQLQSIGGVPLSGKELKQAAQAMADSTEGLVLVDENVDEADLRAQSGAVTANDPDAAEVARERYLRTYGHLDPENLVPEGMKASDAPEVIPTGDTGEPRDQPRPDVQPTLGQGEDAPTADEAEPAPARRSRAKDGES